MVDKYPRRKETLTIKLPSIRFDKIDEPGEDLTSRASDTSSNFSGDIEGIAALLTTPIELPVSPDIPLSIDPGMLLTPLECPAAPSFLPAQTYSSPSYYTTISTPSPVRKQLPELKQKPLNGYKRELISCGGAKTSAFPIVSASMGDLTRSPTIPKSYCISPQKILHLDVPLEPPQLPVFSSRLSRAFENVGPGAIQHRPLHLRKRQQRKVVQVQTLMGGKYR